MLVFSLLRALFYLFNASYFKEVGITDFLVGMWFDLIATCLLFYPLIVFELFPNKNRKSKWLQWITKFFTVLALIFGVLFNAADIEYFKHVSGRSNFGVLKMLTYGKDLQQQLPSFFTDYWYVFLIFTALLLGGFWLLKKIRNLKDDSNEIPLWQQSIWYLVFIAVFIVIGRGGFVSKPINPSQAAKYTSSNKVPLVLNSAFTVLNSWGSTPLEEKEYFATGQLSQHFSPIRQFDGEGKLKGQNVIILMVESFSLEYINAYNHSGTSFTPFFDQLYDSSLVFTNAFANGKKSLDAVPSVVASIPKLMDTEFLISSYTANDIDALPERLSEMKYSTAFYHGATNGSMNFDAFCDLAGFQRYYGRSEYANDSDYDGTWGIYDHKFLDWSVDKISQQQQPFFNVLFTISNHPPHAIPPELEKQFSTAPSPQLKTVMYTDFALKQFFQKARKQSWFANTLFIFTADHTPASKDFTYSNSIGRLGIPLMFYHPSDSSFKGIDSQIVGQVDLMPTILDLTGYKGDIFSFGTSIFKRNKDFTVAQIAGEFIIFMKVDEQAYAMTWRDEQVQGLYELKDREMKENLKDELPQLVKIMETQLKAIIQVHNHSMIYNDLTPDAYLNQ